MSDNKQIKKSFFHYAGVIAILVVLFLLVKKDSVIRWIQAGVTLHRQRDRIEYLIKENARLDKEIRMRSTNRDTLEKYARENFGFCEPGDSVYIIED